MDVLDWRHKGKAVRDMADDELIAFIEELGNDLVAARKVTRTYYEPRKPGDDMWPEIKPIGQVVAPGKEMNVT